MQTIKNAWGRWLDEGFGAVSWKIGRILAWGFLVFFIFMEDPIDAPISKIAAMVSVIVLIPNLKD